MTGSEAGGDVVSDAHELLLGKAAREPLAGQPVEVRDDWISFDEALDPTARPLRKLALDPSGKRFRNLAGLLDG